VKRKNGSRRPSERLGKDRQEPGAGVCNEKIGTWAPEEYPREIYRWRERRIDVEERSRTSGSTHIRHEGSGQCHPGCAKERGSELPFLILSGKLRHNLIFKNLSEHTWS